MLSMSCFRESYGSHGRRHGKLSHHPDRGVARKLVRRGQHEAKDIVALHTSSILVCRPLLMASLS